MWRPLAIEFAIVIERALELPLLEPQFFRTAPGGFGIVLSVVRDDALEAVTVPQNPVDHVAAEARAQSALAVFVDEREGALGVIQAFHQVLERRSPPIAVDGVDKFLAVARRSVEINLDDDVAGGGKQFCIPAIAPLVAYRNLGATVDDEF